MKRLTIMALLYLMGMSAALIANTATAASAKAQNCHCRQVKSQQHHQKHYTFKVAPYCDYHECGGVTREFCHPGHTVRCTADICG